MITSWAETSADQKLVAGIADLSNGDDDYWSFRKEAQRTGVHGLIRYPAMMVPTMQAKLLKAACEAHGGVKHVLDPFVGGGTMLTETMAQGLDFTGCDINPLAILSCKVKAGPYPIDSLSDLVNILCAEISADVGRSYEVSFAGHSKWFTRGASIALSRIRRAVQKQSELWVRQFAWLAMAEVIRRCSNSRTSTYKLHIKPSDEINITSREVIQTYCDILRSNVRRIEEQQEIFIGNDVLDDGNYRGKVGINFQNSTSIDPSILKERFDLLFTSPPYGDNTTTIPYGQFSFLALNWIPIEDIDPAIPPNINQNTRSIDALSMGGSLRDTGQKAVELSEKSPNFKKIYGALGKLGGTCAQRLTGFCYDLQNSVAAMSPLMRKNGYMVWTLGNRCIGGEKIPLDEILADFLQEHDVKRVAQFVRSIPTKRMPARNNHSKTMDSEIVLIARS